VSQHLTEQEEEPPLDEARRLAAHLHELVLTQQTATGELVSARLLPPVLALEDALERIAVTVGSRGINAGRQGGGSQ
jgi:hypothetical protein